MTVKSQITKRNINTQKTNRKSTTF